MTVSLSDLRLYLYRHRGYIPSFIGDIFKVFWWRITRQKIVVITTGSGGVGDYLWIRNYYPIIRQKRYKIILIAMSHWQEIVESFDKDHVDIIRYFESCISPKRIESFFFSLFNVDVFLNFRKTCIADVVRCSIEYNDIDIPEKQFYEEKNNATFSRFLPLPANFKHTLPIIEPKNKINNYVLLVESGNTQGRLSDTQLTSIICHLVSKQYHILLNGNYKQTATLFSPETREYLIDGKAFTFPEYTWLIANAVFVVTVNTALYHFALQLDRPCVVISCNEYHSLKLNQPKEIYVFNEELEKHYYNNTLVDYQSIEDVRITDISADRIIAAIDKISTKLK